jgi:hypothetical protein
MISGLFATDVSATENVGNWQSVAIVLINMIGSVCMAWLRERTNMVKIGRK